MYDGVLIDTRIELGLDPKVDEGRRIQETSCIFSHVSDPSHL